MFFIFNSSEKLRTCQLASGLKDFVSVVYNLTSTYSNTFNNVAFFQILIQSQTSPYLVHFPQIKLKYHGIRLRLEMLIVTM